MSSGARFRHLGSPNIDFDFEPSTEFTLDTITLEQMKSVLPWAHMTRGAWGDEAYKLVRLMCEYADASGLSPDVRFEELAIMLGGERWWTQSAKD